MTLFLIEQPSRVNYYRLRTDEDGRFNFSKVAPGVYKLSDRVVGQPRWRLRVEVKPGEAAFLDLDPGNSTKAPDDFPPPPQLGGDAPSSGLDVCVSTGALGASVLPG